MYCQKCGKYNRNNSIYCSNDGNVLLERKDITLIKNKSNFCTNCGTNVSKHFTYCPNCGSSLFQVGKKTESIKTESKPTKANKFKSINFLSPLKTACIALVVLIVLSFVVTLVANEKINDMIGDLIDLDYDLNIKFANLIDYALLFNITSLKLDLKFLDYGSGIFKYSGGLIAYMSIPFIIFMVLGILKGTKDLEEGCEYSLLHTFLTGLYYGLGLLILSLFGLKKIKVPIPYFNDFLLLTKKYNHFQALFNGLIIGMVSHILGYGLYMSIKKEKERIIKYRYLFNGVYLLVLGYFVCVIVYFVWLKRYVDSNYLSSSNFINTIVQLQLPAYLWNLINFGSFSYSMDYDILNISLLHNLDYLKDIVDLNLIFIYLATLIPFIMFFLQGKSEKKLGIGNLYLNLAYTSITYSTLMTIFTTISNFKLKAYGNAIEMVLDENIIGSFGFKPSITFFSCLLFSYGISLAGAFLTKEPLREVYELNE